MKTEIEKTVGYADNWGTSIRTNRECFEFKVHYAKPSSGSHPDSVKLLLSKVNNKGVWFGSRMYLKKDLILQLAEAIKEDKASK